MRSLPSTLCGFALAVVLPGTAPAQTASDLLAQGVAAYEDFDFPAAAQLLERALAFTPPAGLPDTDRLRALTYLGAAEHFSQRRAEATESFRSAVFLDTRYRPDSLFFPPEILRLYDEALQTTKTVTVETEPLSAFLAGHGSFVATIVPSSFHEITVTIVGSSGRTIRRLYEGPIREAVAVQWDGYGPDERPVSSGHYQFDVASRVTADQVLRRVQVSLEVSVSPADTSPHTAAPPDSLLAPETKGGRRAIGSLLGGVGLGAWAVLVPDLAGSNDASGGRYFVGAALSAASIYAFLHSGRGTPLPANVAANERLRAQWSERSARIAAENAERRNEVEFVIRAGTAERIEGGQ